VISPFFGWMVLAILGALFEIGHPGLFFFLSFSCGAVLAAFSSLIPINLTVQLVVFFVGTALSFFVLRRYVARSLGTSGHRTNVEALVGRRGVVLEQIGPEKPGQVRVGGEAWLARAATADMEIGQGAEVVVVAVRGAHLVVTSHRDH